MTDTTNSVPESDETFTEPTHTIGSLLKAARNHKGLSVEDIAKALNLRITLIQDIENDVFSNMASSTYARGYVKNYARYVVADPFLINECIEKQLITPPSPSMQSFSNKTSRQAVNSQWMWVTYLIIAILVGLLGWWGIQKSTLFSGLVDLSEPSIEEKQDLQNNELSKVDSKPATEASHSSYTAESRTLPAKEIEPSSENKQVINQNNTQEAALIATPKNNNEALKAKPEPVTTFTEVPAVNNVNDSVKLTEINLTLTGDCWIKIQDATGKVIVSGLKRQGQVITVEGVAPFKTILGAPESVKITVNGAAVKMDDYPAGKTARMTLAQ